MDKIWMLSLAVAITGIVGLWFVSSSTEPVQTDIGGITEDNIGKYISVSAEISKISESESGLFMTLTDTTGSIKAVLWKQKYNKLENITSLKDGSFIIAEGKIALYRGEIEILVDIVNQINDTD